MAHLTTLSMFDDVLGEGEEEWFFQKGIFESCHIILSITFKTSIYTHINIQNRVCLTELDPAI